MTIAMLLVILQGDRNEPTQTDANRMGMGPLETHYQTMVDAGLLDRHGDPCDSVVGRGLAVGSLAPFFKPLTTIIQKKIKKI